jgi:hypothetical protein
MLLFLLLFGWKNLVLLLFIEVKGGKGDEHDGDGLYFRSISLSNSLRFN